MADRLPRFCIFGDSHYACLKQAEMQGLVDVSGIDLEYWGHVGGRFRYLEARDGAIYPKDDFTAMRFAKFNAKGRTFLPAHQHRHLPQPRIRQPGTGKPGTAGLGRGHRPRHSATARARQPRRFRRILAISVDIGWGPGRGDRSATPRPTMAD